MKWPEVELSTVTDKCDTWNPNIQSAGSFDYIDISSVNKDEKVIDGVETIDCMEAPSRARQLVRRNDVIVSTVRPNLNGVALVRDEHDGMTASTGFSVLRPCQTKIDSGYLFYWVRSPEFVQRMIDVSTGANYPAVSDTNVRRSTIPLPPLAEQKRIARILDQADALRVKRRETIKQLDTLVQSVFLDMFGDPVTNPKGWDRCTLRDVINSAKDGPHVSPEYENSGIPFLSTRNVRPGRIIWDDAKFISATDAAVQWRKCKPEKGDVLYTKGGTTGIAATVKTTKEFAIWVHIALLKPVHGKVDPQWLESMLNSDFCYAQAQRFTRGIANRDLGLKRMVKISMYLPPMELQGEYSAIVERINHQLRLATHHFEEADHLFFSLQSRAFKGEL